MNPSCSSQIIKIFKPQKGTILLLAILILGVLLMLGVYFLTFCLTESRISQSQKIATQTYYLAEAGINRAIWKLKNEEPWKTCFVTSSPAYNCNDCKNWQASFEINLIPNSTTTVAIVNNECARGKITATSTVLTPDKKIVQRVIKTTVYKSLTGLTQGAAVLSGGASENINIDFSKIKVFGNLSSNHNLSIKWLSIVETYATGSGEGKILSVGNYIKSWDSTVLSPAICGADICQSTSTCACMDTEKFEKCKENSCPPKSATTPLVDFDSPATTSFKTRAQNLQGQNLCQNLCNGITCICDEGSCSGGNKCVLSSSEFEDLLWAAGKGGTLTLNTISNPGIIYVTGPIDVRGGRHLVVNGALVANDTINIGEYYKWTKKGQKDEGFSQLTINRPTDTTTSGLLTKAKINFGLYSSFTTTIITGVIFANDEIKLTSLPKNFIIKGGIIGRKLAFISILEWLNFILDDEIIRYGLGYKIDGTLINPSYSPIITVEHWEEKY